MASLGGLGSLRWLSFLLHELRQDLDRTERLEERLRSTIYTVRGNYRRAIDRAQRHRHVASLRGDHDIP